MATTKKKTTSKSSKGKATVKKKTTAKKTAPRKAAAKKPVKKKVTPKKAAPKKVLAKKPVKKKVAPKKAAPKKVAVKKPVKKKAAPKKVVQKTEISSQPSEVIVPEKQLLLDPAPVSPPDKSQMKKTKKSPKRFIAPLLLMTVILVLAYLYYPDIQKYFDENETIPKESGVVSVMKPDKSLEEKDVVETTEPVKEKAPEVEPGDDSKYYTVKVKDQLTDISKKLFGKHEYWKKIYKANEDNIKDPNLIFPGQKLRIPDID